MTSHDIEVVLFDLGGVLVELTGTTTLMSWTRIHQSPEKLWDFWLTSPTVRAFETGKSEADEFADRLIEELDLSVEREIFIAAFTHWPKRLFTGALDLVGEVRPSLVRATLSNTNSLHWPRLMHEMELADAFDHHFPSHLTGNIKPDKSAFETVLEKMSWRPRSVLFLDDNLPNVETAASLGVQAFQVRGIDEARTVLERAHLLR